MDRLLPIKKLWPLNVSLNTYDDDWEKCNDVRSISTMNKVSFDWFRRSRGIIALRSIFTVLCYEIRCSG
jgi:hypothetical protein